MVPWPRELKVSAGCTDISHQSVARSPFIRLRYIFPLQSLKSLYSGRKSKVWAANYMPSDQRVALKAYLRSEVTEADIVKVWPCTPARCLPVAFHVYV